jgi:hypothetical protein
MFDAIARATSDLEARAANRAARSNVLVFFVAP